jgi:aryl sulfotransferase
MSPKTVWLASYPKSGSTWVRALLASLRRDEHAGPINLDALGGGPIASSRGHFEHQTGLVSSDLTPAEILRLRPAADAALDARLEDVRVRKIHDALMPGPIVPAEATLGALCVVRDPRDVAVSLAHHTGRDVALVVAEMAAPGGAMGGSTERLDPQLGQHLGSWSTHVTGWLDHELFPVLLIRYEDLHSDPFGQLARIAGFAGLAPSPEAITAAAQAAGFDRLREQEARDGFAERPSTDRPFFRRGASGAWRDELDPGLVARVENDHAGVMRRLGYERAAHGIARP